MDGLSGGQSVGLLQNLVGGITWVTSGMVLEAGVGVDNQNWALTSTLTYGTAKKKRPCYLVATNWPIEKALHAIGYNQIPTK